jgi:hypothetical protein
MYYCMIVLVTNEMLHADITVKTQWTRVCNTHAREATNCHQNSHAINQLSRHRRQPPPILLSEGVVVMDRVNRRRAKQSGSTEVRIGYTTLSPQCKSPGVGDEHLHEKHWCLCEHLWPSRKQQDDGVEPWSLTKPHHLALISYFVNFILDRMFPYFIKKLNILTRKSCIRHQAKRRQKKKNLSPRNRKACHSISTTLLQSIADVGTQSTMESSRKTLH